MVVNVSRKGRKIEEKIYRCFEDSSVSVYACAVNACVRAYMRAYEEAEVVNTSDR